MKKSSFILYFAFRITRKKYHALRKENTFNLLKRFEATRNSLFYEKTKIFTHLNNKDSFKECFHDSKAYKQ